MTEQRRSPHQCLGCQAHNGVSTDTVRWYRKRDQRQWTVRLCYVCRGALQDLIEVSALAVTHGMFDPPTESEANLKE